jgi:hypothetical protein
VKAKFGWDLARRGESTTLPASNATKEDLFRDGEIEFVNRIGP